MARLGTWSVFIACVETWHACTYETFGVHSRFGGTSVAFGGIVELGARSGVVVCRWVVVLCCSVVVVGRSSFPIFGKLGGFCRVGGTFFLHLFTYSARLVGCFRQCSIGRSGGLPTEGLRGHPLTIPFLAEYQGIYIFTP